MPNSICTHQDQIKEVAPSSDTCQECVAEGVDLVELRQCLSCGKVACCDRSPRQHARKHFNETGHPIIESFKTAAANTKEWRYCYIDTDYV